MAKLVKVKSSTLVEAIVATILIVVVFIIASLSLNNLLLNTFSNNIHPVETRLNELEYRMANNHISIPYAESVESWNISIDRSESELGVILIYSAVNTVSNKEVKRIRIYAK